MKQHRWPILTLFILSPMIGELLSGSAPPVEFFNPFGLMILTALYGSGALLIRDMVRRWGKGWISVVLLGMAYGIYEEGLVVRSFFDSTWMDLGALAEYGRWLGVNWLWTLDLTIYHAVVSITIPILLVDLIFPAHRDQPWLSRRGRVVFTLLFLLTLVFGPLAGMKASPLHLLGSLIVMGVLGLAAYLWPVRREGEGKRVYPAPVGCFTLLGFCGMLLFFLAMYLMPELNFPALLGVAFSGYLPLAVGLLVWMLGGAGMQDKHRWGLSAGALGVMVLLAIIQEADQANRVDNTSGMACVGMFFMLLMLAVGLYTWRRRLNETSREEVAAQV